MPESENFQSMLAEAKRLRGAGIAFQDALPALRRISPSPVDSVKAGRDAYGLRLDEAKAIVHSSEAWCDRRDEFEQLHAEAEAATDDI